MSDEPIKFSNDPLTYFKDTESSRRAIYTCQDCGCRHKGWNPDECYECGCADLEWSYGYGYQGRFA